ncbi:MAG: hypothetical protein WDN46_06435 [Methylocella sp.]
MRLGIKIGLVAGAALMGSLGFAGLGQAAPLSGLAGAGSSVKIAGESVAPEAQAQKAYWRRHWHHHWHRYYHRW